MPNLLSGSLLRSGGSGEFLGLAAAQPQLPPTDTTSTGFTLITDGLLRTSYRSSLGNIEFKNAELWSNLTTGTIRILATGTDIASTSTNTGLLVVDGDIGVWGTMNIGKDININGITIGQGYEGINNIIVRGTALPLPNDFETGQSSIAVGHDTLLGIATSYKTIAIGRYALSSGTEISNSIAIGDSALKSVGVYPTLIIATVTNVTLSNPVVITAPGHNLNTGTAVKLFNIDGTVELNDTVYYVEPSTTTVAEFALYSDILRTTPIDGTGFTPYISGTTGTVNRLYYQDSNIAIGAGAGELLIDGEDNIFIAHRAARIWTTGSNNIIIGQNTAKFINTGSGIISIGGDNLVDGLDNQVNIGSVFYYDGRGYAYIAADTSVGLGTNSTGTSSGALIVAGGVGIAGDVYSELCGNPEEDFLLYTPKITTTSTQPTGARIGDIWIDFTVPAYLQYIKDGTSTFWIQVGAV
jgi:hypothetical protein